MCENLSTIKPCKWYIISVGKPLKYLYAKFALIAPLSPLADLLFDIFSDLKKSTKKTSQDEHFGSFVRRKLPTERARFHIYLIIQFI